MDDPREGEHEQGEVFGGADQVVFHTRTGKLTDPAVRAVIVPVLGRIARLPHVSGVVSLYQTGAHAISTAGTIGFATVEFDQNANQLPTAAVERVIHTATSVRSPALQVELGGDAVEQTQSSSLGIATIVGLVAAVVVLLLTFGSPAAMSLPIMTALLGLGASLGAITLASHVLDMVDFASELALLIGLVSASTTPCSYSRATAPPTATTAVTSRPRSSRR